MDKELIEKLAEELLSLFDMQPDHIDAPDPTVKNISNIIGGYARRKIMSRELIEKLAEKLRWYEIFGMDDTEERVAKEIIAYLEHEGYVIVKKEDWNRVSERSAISMTYLEFKEMLNGQK